MDPAAPPPTTGPPDGTPTGPARSTAATSGRRTAPWLLGIAVLVALALTSVLVVRGLLRSSDPVATDPLPTSSVSGWDDSSPTQTPSQPEEPSPTPSEALPTPTPPAAEPVECPDGDPTARQDHPADGRVHGGGLSFPSQQRGFEPAGPVGVVTWAYDVAGQTRQVEPAWISLLAVGALFTGDGFDEPRRAAELVIQCTISSPLYLRFSERTDLWSKAVTVDGRPGWSIRTEIRVDDTEVEAEGDLVEVVVVDTGSPESLAMFLGAVPLGDQALTRTLDRTVGGLRVE